jgi:hypothetical protein
MMGINYIQPSESFDPVAIDEGYNLGALSTRVNIKDVRADAAGVVNTVDCRGVAVTFNALHGETLNIRGKCQIVADNTVALQVYL